MTTKEKNKDLEVQLSLLERQIDEFRNDIYWLESAIAEVSMDRDYWKQRVNLCDCGSASEPLK